MFSAEQRERARESLLALAERDQRISAAALIGGSTAAEVDRWSDLDLGFAVAAGHDLREVVADWTSTLRQEFRAEHLFDVGFRTSLYRVFLLPGSLQVDLSFTPEADFGAYGPHFSLVFGDAVRHAPPPPAPAAEVFGLGVHHALRGRICIERGRLWQAEHWISGVRDQALVLACRRLELDPREGRGYDALPAAVLALAAPALAQRVEPAELLRALGAAIDLLLTEEWAAPELAERLRSPLAELAAPGPLS